MLLQPIRQNKWKIFAVCSDAGACQVADFFDGIESKYEASADNLLSLLDTVSKDLRGPTLLPVEKSHFVDQDNKIYEFVSGDIRLLWFYSKKESRVIICTCAFIKKGQKIEKKVKKSAVNAMKKYLADCASGNLHYTEGEDE